MLYSSGKTTLLKKAFLGIKRSINKYKLYCAQSSSISSDKYEIKWQFKHDFHSNTGNQHFGQDDVLSTNNEIKEIKSELKNHTAMFHQLISTVEDMKGQAFQQSLKDVGNDLAQHCKNINELEECKKSNGNQFHLKLSYFKNQLKDKLKYVNIKESSNNLYKTHSMLDFSESNKRLFHVNKMLKIYEQTLSLQKSQFELLQNLIKDYNLDGKMAADESNDVLTIIDQNEVKKVSDEVKPKIEDSDVTMHMIMKQLRDLGQKVQLHDTLLNKQKIHHATAEINQPHIVKVAHHAFPDISLGNNSSNSNLFPNPLSNNNIKYPYNNHNQSPLQITSDIIGIKKRNNWKFKLKSIGNRIKNSIYSNMIVKEEQGSKESDPIKEKYLLLGLTCILIYGCAMLAKSGKTWLMSNNLTVPGFLASTEKTNDGRIGQKESSYHEKNGGSIDNINTSVDVPPKGMEKKDSNNKLAEEKGCNVKKGQKFEEKKKLIYPISGFEIFSDRIENDKNNNFKVSLDGIEMGIDLKAKNESQRDWKKKDGFFSLNCFNFRNSSKAFLNTKSPVVNQNFSDTDKNNNTVDVHLHDSKIIKETEGKELTKEEELDNEILDFVSSLFAFQGDVTFENPAFNTQLDENEEEKLFMPYARRNPIYESNFETGSNLNVKKEDHLGQMSNVSKNLEINKKQYKKIKNTTKKEQIIKCYGGLKQIEIKDMMYEEDDLEQTELPTQWVSIHDIYKNSSNIIPKDHLIES